MNDILEVALILDHKRYKLFYNSAILLSVILFVFIIIIFTCKYQSYYITLGTMIDNKLELLVDVKDFDYVKNNSKIIIDNITYDYQIELIDDKLYRDDNYHNYKNIYLNIKDLNNIDNYVYQIKIPKIYKTLASYIKDYMKEV